VTRYSAWVAAPLLLFLAASSACANRTGAAADMSATPPPPVQDVLVPDATAPLGAHGKEVADVRATALPFVPISMKAVEPASQWVLLEGNTAASEAAYVYSTPDWGDVTVLETLHQGTNDDQLTWEATLKDTGCSLVPAPDSDFVGQTCSFDPFERVELSNGIVALLAETGSSPTSVSWVQAAKGIAGVKLDSDLNLHIEVVGSPLLSGAEATKVADLLVEGDG
jgi:hypothetical protein